MRFGLSAHKQNKWLENQYFLCEFPFKPFGRTIKFSNHDDDIEYNVRCNKDAYKPFPRLADNKFSIFFSSSSSLLVGLSFCAPSFWPLFGRKRTTYQHEPTKITLKFVEATGKQSPSTWQNILAKVLIIDVEYLSHSKRLECTQRRSAQVHLDKVYTLPHTHPLTHTHTWPKNQRPVKMTSFPTISNFRKAPNVEQMKTNVKKNPTKFSPSIRRQWQAKTQTAKTQKKNYRSKMSKNIKFNEQTRQLTIKWRNDEKERAKTIVIKIYCPSFFKWSFVFLCFLCRWASRKRNTANITIS